MHGLRARGDPNTAPCCIFLPRWPKRTVHTQCHCQNIARCNCVCVCVCVCGVCVVCVCVRCEYRMHLLTLCTARFVLAHTGRWRGRRSTKSCRTK